MLLRFGYRNDARTSMNVALKPSMTASPAATNPPRIRYIDPLAVSGAAGMESALARASALGFDGVLVPPPWRPGAAGDRFVSASFAEIDPALGSGSSLDYLTAFATSCRSAGLLPMVDVSLAPVSAEFTGDTGPFLPAESSFTTDPRLGLAKRRPIRDMDAAGAWWGRHFAALADTGIAGVRLLDLAHAPGVIGALRRAAPSLTLIAWTPGMPREAVAGLHGVDYVVSSLPWWDLRADWFWDELASLRQIAPVLSCPEEPFGPRAAAEVHNPAMLAASLRRAAAIAAATGDGWIVPDRFETGSRRSMNRFGPVPSRAKQPAADLVDLATLNQLVGAGNAAEHGLQVLSAPGIAPAALLRTDTADARFASRASLWLVNTDLERPRILDPADYLARIDATFGPWQPGGLEVGHTVSLEPGELRRFDAPALAKGSLSSPVDAAAAQRLADGPRVAIESPSPCVDDGRLPVKRLVGELVAVEVDIVCDGHDKLSAMLQWRYLSGGRDQNGTALQEARMVPIGNDRYRAELPLSRIGGYAYTVQAWRDVFATYADEIAKKSRAGLDVSLELREGMALLDRTIARVTGERKAALQATASDLATATDAEKLARFLSPAMTELMQAVDDRPRAAMLERPVRIDAERSGAAFSAWYEVFPRSMSDDPNRHGTFRDVERHLPRVKAMGFDVLYFPPISPIGRSNRKGPNNTLTPAEGDPGSPYAIGSEDGGHDALHPELGTLDDFKHLVAAAADHGLEIAIDFAIQCSPDHPWLKQHRGWFDWRPDGSIKYAENPPKKYQDIVNVDFYAEDAVPGLWVALAEVVMFWMEAGVRCVRVDNPHTKPFPFWQWMIATVRDRYPDAVFLAEAFTRPKVMYRLAKVGFSQSYTYFTWRETKREMEQYVTELAEHGPREFFRPHFFVNTPDINPVYLQNAPRSAYLIRAALAATLSGLWGVYNGFELCEGTPVPGREEYLDSEKYQTRVWDWDRPGNIVPEITALNRIRHDNPALRSHLNTAFLLSANDAVSVFMKTTPDRSNVLVVAISFDPNQAQESNWEFPFWLWQASESTTFEAEDLLTRTPETWRGKYQFVRLDPARPYAIWRIRAAT